MTRSAKSSAVVLEVRDRQVGVLVPERACYLFYSAVPEATRLDGVRYRSVAECKNAVAAMLGHAGAGTRPTHTSAGAWMELPRQKA
jgi:hypothetical protein